MKHLPLVGAIASARLSTTNSQSLCVNKFKLMPLLIKRLRTLAVACGLVLALTALPAHAQTCTPLPPGMIAWWPLDNSSDDIVGTNNPPSSAGAITYAPGMVGAGVDVSLNPLGISVLKTPSLNLLGSDFSIDAWVKMPQNVAVENHFIFLNYAGVPSYQLYINSQNKAAAGFRPGVAITGGLNDPFVEAVGTTNMNDGQWHHLVGVRSGATATQAGATASIYVDGNLEGSSTNNAVLGVNGGSVDTGVYGCLYARLGAVHSGPGHCTSPTASPAEPHFPGVIDEVELFNRALSPSEIQALYAAGAAGKCKLKGMTWHVGAVNPIDGAVTVGCANCNPYTGDHTCSASLPLLCFKPFTPRLPVPASVNDTDYYNRWSGGIVGTTAPVQASSFNKSLALANKACAQEFDPTNPNPDWRVAEFHDGANGVGGWNFQAYGNVGNPSSRFWVHINDQPNGTCWPNP